MNSEYLRNWCLLPKSLLEFARAFKPDIIFSVVDDWHMGLAWQLSRKLKVPLAVDFQDLFAVSLSPTKVTAAISASAGLSSMNRYRFLNKNAGEVRASISVTKSNRGLRRIAAVRLLFYR